MRFGLYLGAAVVGRAELGEGQRAVGRLGARARRLLALVGLDRPAVRGRVGVGRRGRARSGRVEARLVVGDLACAVGGAGVRVRARVRVRVRARVRVSVGVRVRVKGSG